MNHRQSLCLFRVIIRHVYMEMYHHVMRGTVFILGIRYKSRLVSIIMYREVYYYKFRYCYDSVRILQFPICINNLTLSYTKQYFITSNHNCFIIIILNGCLHWLHLCRLQYQLALLSFGNWINLLFSFTIQQTRTPVSIITFSLDHSVAYLQ